MITKVGVITYSSVTREGNDICLNRAFGLYLDGLAKHFSKLYYVAGIAEEDPALYQAGKSLYQYRLQSSNVEFVGLRQTFRKKNPFSAAAAFFQNVKIILKVTQQTDALYIFMPCYTGLVSCFLARCYRKPHFLYFGTVWDATAYRFSTVAMPSLIKRGLMRGYLLFEKSMVSSAMGCLVAGKRLAEIYKKSNPNTYETVPLLPFRVSDFSDEEQNSPELPKQDIRLLFVGPVKFNKGLVHLMEAMSLLRNQGLTTFLTIVGAMESMATAALREKIRQLSLDSNVTFAGYVSDAHRLKQFYQQAHLFITPTLHEGFPRVIYEAMLFGLPVIATAIPNIQAHLEGLDAAILVPPADAGALAEAILRLWQDPDLRSKLLENSRKYIAVLRNQDPAVQHAAFFKDWLGELPSGRERSTRP